MSIEQPKKPHALVLGASGISGWSLINQLVEYPSKDTWAQISGTTSRPFDSVKSGLPADARIRIASGIDLTQDVDSITQALKDNVKNIETVTHVFFTVFIAKDNPQEYKAINTLVLEHALLALNQVSPLIKVVILQTGGKTYGFGFPNKIKIIPPLKENYPRIDRPMADELFYYAQVDKMKGLEKQSNWTFAEVRPDGIVGYVPGSSPMNMAQGIALYLSVHRAVHGKGVVVPYPGSEKAWHTKHSDTFQDVLSRAEIYIAINDQVPKSGAAYNVADEDEPIVWSEKWPAICREFGLVGIPPLEYGPSQTMEDFVKQHRAEWKALCTEHSLRPDTIDLQVWRFMQLMLNDFDFDRYFDLSKLRQVGFTESIDSVKAYRISFDRMAAAGIIPKAYLE